MGHCFSQVGVVSIKSKKKKKKKNFFFFFFLLNWENRHGIGKKVAIFDWEWGQNSDPREGQKIPCMCAECSGPVGRAMD